MSTTENHYTRESHHDDDSRRLVLVLASWWREIVFGTVLLAAAGGAAVLALEVVLPKYEAWADVAIIPTETDVAFDDRFQAVTDVRSRRGMDMRARRAALVGLVENGNIATAVAQRIEWPQEDRDDGFLLAKLLISVEGALVTVGPVTRNNQSDLIRLTAVAKSPELAVAIANAWVEEYVSEVNQLYQRVPQKVIDTIRTEAQHALRVYEKSQKEIELFAAQNELFRLENQIRTNNQSVEQLYKIREDGFAALFNKPMEAHIAVLARLYDERVKLEGLLDAAIALRTQIEAAGGAGIDSNAMAIQLLNFQIYSSRENLPDNLEIKFDHARRIHTDVSGQKAEAGTIVTSLRDRIEKIDRKASERSKVISSLFKKLDSELDTETAGEYLGLDRLAFGLRVDLAKSENRILTIISEISVQTQSLQSQLESLIARKQKLEQSRDLARSTFETLRNEEIELQLTAAAAPSMVRLASFAVLPEESAWPNPALVMLVAGVVGLPIMTFLAFFVNFLGIRPFFGKLEARPSERTQPPG